MLLSNQERHDAYNYALNSLHTRIYGVIAYGLSEWLHYNGYVGFSLKDLLKGFPEFRSVFTDKEFGKYIKDAHFDNYEDYRLIDMIILQYCISECKLNCP